MPYLFRKQFYNNCSHYIYYLYKSKSIKEFQKISDLYI